MEVAPFINEEESTAIYDMIVFEKSIWKKLYLGFETENVHKKEKDSLSVGPRISLPIGELTNFQTSLALAYQIRSGEADALRFYLVFNRRFKIIP